jgi:hypothetical protein
MSMVKMVELLLKMDVSEDINALSITASIRPRAPATVVEINYRINWNV